MNENKQQRRCRAVDGAMTAGWARRQLDLFSQTPSARRTDPMSSYHVAERQTETGKRAGDCKRVLAVMEQMLAVGFDRRVTALEIVYVFGKNIAPVLDRHMVSRRLPDLVRAGLVANEIADGDGIVRRATKVCSICGHTTLAWWIRR